MFLYADRTVCPRCREALAPATPHCDHCSARLDDRAAYDVFLALQQVDRLVQRISDRPLVATTAAPAYAGGEEPATTPTPPMPAAAQRTAPPSLPVSGPEPASAVTPGRPVFSGLTVPKILLGLGALCLVVAALVFLVVAWASLGVGGRTAVLVGFTLVAGGLAAWSARSGLRAGAESMTAVALGLLTLDLAGAQGAGWFGDLDAGGFLVLAGSTVLLTASAATVATRRTAEPRLLSAEVGGSIGIVVALAGLADDPAFSPAGWLTASLAITGLLALLGWRLRLGLTTWTAAGLGCASWLGLATIGTTRVLAHPSWSGLAEDLRAWPLVVAAALAATPAVATRLPLVARVAGPATAVFLLTVLAAAPALDEGPEVGALAAVAVVAVHAALSWLLPRPWHHVALAPLAIAGGSSLLIAVAAALQAVADSPLLDHGLWSGDAADQVAAAHLDGAWAALMPLTAAAAAAALTALARLAGQRPSRVAVSAAAVVLAMVAVAPVLYGVPRYAAVASIVLVAVALLGWALVRADALAGALGTLLYCLAIGAALADDGLTLAVLGLLTAAIAVTELRRAPAWLACVASLLLPASAAATTWAAVSAGHLEGGWRAAPVIAVVSALALARPTLAHEAVGLGSALLAIAASAGFVPVDPRLVAGQLVAVALVATYVGVRRRPEASLIGLVLLGAAGLTAWEHGATAATVLAIACAVAVLHELRGEEPAALAARGALPAGLGALLWTVTGLAGLATAWQGVPAVVALGVLAVWRPDPVREVPAALVGMWAAAAALASLPDPQGWTAVYLTLGGVACTVSSLLHPTRRRVAWAGLALLTAATWLRLEQLGVGTVEAYTLPLAAVLLVVGTVALLRSDRSSLQTQGAGLGLALVPSLLQALAEPLALRAVLLGLGCVLLIGVGVGRRWAAPLLAGGGTLAVLVARQATIAQVLPQWALIALAGMLLTFLGLTWERRLANVRTAADYVRGLR